MSQKNNLKSTRNNMRKKSSEESDLNGNPPFMEWEWIVPLEIISFLSFTGNITLMIINCIKPDHCPNWLQWKLCPNCREVGYSYNATYSSHCSGASWPNWRMKLTADLTAEPTRKKKGECLYHVAAARIKAKEDSWEALGTILSYHGSPEQKAVSCRNRLWSGL